MHALHLKRLVTFLKELQTYGAQWKTDNLGNAAGGQASRQEVVTPGELVRRLGRKVEAVNLLDINSYLRSSKVCFFSIDGSWLAIDVPRQIARKINGYSDKLAEKAVKDGMPYFPGAKGRADNGYSDPAKLARLRRGGNPPLHIIESFIVALTEANDGTCLSYYLQREVDLGRLYADGRITISLAGEPGHERVDYKYQLLNPATHFQQVLDEARCVVLAGGTMSPVCPFPAFCPVSRFVEQCGPADV